MGDLTGAITDVAIDTTNSAIVTVTFSLADAAGNPVTNTDNKRFRFQISKLVPATDERPAYWQPYLNRSRGGNGDPVVLFSWPERAVPVEVSPGTFQYTFATDLDTVADFVYFGSGNEPFDGNTVGISNSGAITSDVGLAEIASRDWTFDPTAVHRIAIAGQDGAYYNASIDFVPASLPGTLAAKANQVVTNESCGACHGDPDNRGRLVSGLPHGGTNYFTVEVCQACHSGNSYNAEASTDTEWEPIDMVTAVHKTHAAHEMEFEYFEFAELTYPQSVGNCRTCHENGRVAQPANRDPDDAMAWMTLPSQQACGSCHEAAGLIDFSNHFGNQPDNLQCGTCHGPTRSLPVNVAHANQYSTPNNPELPAGVGALEYQIASVTVDAANQPIVKFRILLNGSPLNLASLPTGMAFGGSTSPGFKIAWSSADTLPNGSVIAKPVDFNNVGGTGRTFYGFGDDPYAAYPGFSKIDQPFTVGLRDIVASLTGPDAEGYYTTVAGISPTAPVTYPAGASLRSVAIESYFTFNVGTPDQINVAADASFKGVAGEERRVLVDIDTCNTCHEGLGFHSNSGRRNNANHCAMCHNPENSSSNTFAGYVTGTAGLFSLTPIPDSFVVAQKPMNLKDLVHSLHAGSVREVPFNFIRGTLAGNSGAGAYEFSEITYPQRVASCNACHSSPAQYAIPVDSDALWSVIAVEPGVSTTRLPPTVSACWSCHDNTLATAHMQQNSGDFVGIETCELCHAPGKSAEAHTN